MRYYRLKVTYTDNITESDGVAGSNLRYIEDNGNVEISTLFWSIHRHPVIG
jgi:hypothetical protein